MQSGQTRCLMVLNDIIDFKQVQNWINLNQIPAKVTFDGIYLLKLKSFQSPMFLGNGQKKMT